MRILIDSGDYRCSNMGDLAMLQVTVGRLSRLFPNSTIGVITSNAQTLEKEVAPAKAVPREGMQLWFAEQYLLGRVQHSLPESASRQIVKVTSALRRRWPEIVETMVRVKVRVSGVTNASVLEFLRAVREADLIVLCGQGGINDMFRKHALEVLGFVEMAVRSGKHTALFSQGIGPMGNAELMDKAADVLRRADLIAVREGKFGPVLLREMKVGPDRILNTGDDAIELAYEARTGSVGGAIGVNLRLAEHTGIGQDVISRLRPLFEQLATKFAAPLLPVPISRYPDFKDARDIARLLSGIESFEDNGRDLDTPLQVIHQVGRCRIVVTAAYHAAVFALSQGIPVVGLTKSQYCLDKFLGLDHQFGTGVEIVSLDGPALENEFVKAVERAWRSAEEARVPLLSAAHQQIEIGRAAYLRVAEIFDYNKAAA
ncbi:MAG: polysaccharide pyruvyl transferase family protein [Pyrinomonadaceae bacterium]|nr:polysaccharide pyruvyl transferase family protein [Pyrinomonadaceae bacterium]